jgi:hypothetical protein
MTQASSFNQASAIAAALNATLTPLDSAVSGQETYVLALNEHKSARLTLQFGRKRYLDQIFFDALFPGDTMRAGERVSRHYRVAIEMNELGSTGEWAASINEEAARIAADVERHLIRDYLQVLERVLVFFPDTVPVAATEKFEGKPMVGRLAL